MGRAAVVYDSRTGITRRMAEEIADLLEERGLTVELTAVDHADVATLDGVDYLLLGAWTRGWFVIRQHPDERFVDFARRLPAIRGARVALFTTYKLAIGGMFREVRRHLDGKVGPVELELKSRDGHLTADQRRALESFVAS